MNKLREARLTDMEIDEMNEKVAKLENVFA